MSKSTYERLSIPRQAAQAVRDWSIQNSGDDEIVLRLDKLGTADVRNRYVFMALSFGQVDRRDGMFGSIYSPVFDGLEITAVANDEHRDEGFYSWGFSFDGERYGLRHIGLGKATVILDTLRTIEGAMERARDKGLQPTTFGSYVAFICNVLGVKAARVRGKHGVYRWADMADVLGILSSAEDCWKRGVLDERETAA